ncbi:ankyrin [Whalleya microplaca]|nr:ankyrin [Whalleya microplaca]
MIDLLLRQGADINALSRGFCECVLPFNYSRQLSAVRRYPPLWTPLHTAICHDHESTTELLLSRGASTDVSPRFIGSDIRRVTALHIACCVNLTSISRLLIDKGYQSNVDVEDHAGRTPIGYAYYSGSWASIDLLLEAGATLDVPLGSFTLLEHACLDGHFAEALRLIELGADAQASLEYQDPGPHSKLLRFCCLGTRYSSRGRPGRKTDQQIFRTELVQTLIKANANLDAKTSLTIPLMEASYFGLAEVVEILLAAGANANYRDFHGATALTKALSSLGISRDGSILRIIKALLAHMRGFDTFDVLKKLCGSLGSTTEKAAVLHLLLEHGGSWALDCDLGQKLLLEAVKSGNFDLSDILFQEGLRHPNENELETIIRECLELDDPDGLGYILGLPGAFDIMMTEQRLYDAIKDTKTACTIFLISAGAPITYKTITGRTCLLEASKYSTTVIASILLDKGADPNEIDDNGNGPLFSPINSTGYIPMIRLLIDRGTKIHEPLPENDYIMGHHYITECPSSPLDHAIYCCAAQAVDVMVDSKAYWKSTEEQRNAHLLTACRTARGQSETSPIFTTLILRGKANPNVIFPIINLTPLHICANLGNHIAAKMLVKHGADIHLKLPRPEPGSRLPEQPENPCEGTTPLGWAISVARVRVLEGMLDETLDDPFPSSRDALVLDYVKLACNRHSPKVIELLVSSGLDANFRDDKGDPFLTLLCKAIQAIPPFEDPDLPAATIAKQSAESFATLLDAGADPDRMNNEGVTPSDHLRRMMSYAGPSEVHQQVAETWKEMFLFNEDGTLEITG